MPYNHRDNLKELAYKAGIFDGFDYSVNDPFGLTEQYFQFCQQNLSEECEKYNIQPARIYIRRWPTVNARAGRPAGYSVIAMNYGTMPALFRLFTDHNLSKACASSVKRCQTTKVAYLKRFFHCRTLHPLEHKLITQHNTNTQTFTRLLSAFDYESFNYIPYRVSGPPDCLVLK